MFSAVAQLQDERKTEADLLIQDVCGWLKMDEHALAGGLAPKLSEAEGRAIKLLTPPKHHGARANATDQSIRRSPSRAGSKLGQAASSAESTRSRSPRLKRFLQKLEQNPKLRLTIQWTLEEESP